MSNYRRSSMNPTILDFEQAKSKHLLFKSRLRSILYDIPVEEGPVLSHHECSVGQWIYSHALQTYGYIPEMRELEVVHADIHITARKLVALHKEGKTHEARSGLSEMELVADKLVRLLDVIKQKLADAPGVTSAEEILDFKSGEYHELLLSNAELDKRIQQQITENNAATLKYETVLAALQEGIIIQDAHGVLQSANQSAVELLGLTFDQTQHLTLINPVLALIYENGKSIPGNQFPPMLALSTGEAQINHTIGIRREAASVLWLCVNSRPLIDKTNGHITGVVTSLFDITGARLAEQELSKNFAEQQSLNEELAASNEEQAAVNEELSTTNEELVESQEVGRVLMEQLEMSENRFRFLLNAIPQQVWTATPDGALNYVNQVVCVDFGYNTHEVVGHGWQAFIHPDDLPICLDKWIKALETGSEYVVEFRLKFKNGSYYWHLARALPFVEYGQIKLWVGTNTNIEVQKANEKRKDEFLSIASHELRMPLTSIKAYNQLIQRTVEPAKLASFGKKSGEHIKRLEKLIDDLLDVTKFNAGKLNFTMQHFNFGEMVADTIETARHFAGTHEIIIENIPDVDYYGDHFRLEQVLTNFLTNAIKYSPGADKIIVKVKVDDDNIIVSVQDFGIGIARDHLDHLFDRYYRVDNTSMRFEGLGLGLFISSEILKRHKGSFWIESAPGKGSTFFFRLPREKEGSKQPVIKTGIFYKDDKIRIAYDRASRRIDVDWTGFQDMESIKKGCMLMLDYLSGNRCDRVVNDNTNVEGNWADAVEWVGNDWFPMMEKAGLKYFAHIFSPSTFSQLSARKSIDIMAGIITTQYFTEIGLAEKWINERPR